MPVQTEYGLMLEAKNIGVSIKGTVLLKAVSLHLEPGEILALVGPNGAGKSTLLKALAGDIPLSEGVVKIRGRALGLWPARELARVRAVLSQSVHLNFPLSVQDTVELGRYPYAERESRQKSRDIAAWALAEVEMNAFAQRDISTLSGGEQQRVHLARLLTQLHDEHEGSDKFVLLDEPVSSLDIAQQYNMLGLFRGLARKLNMGVLVILHDMNLAVQFADRVVMLKNGSVYSQGLPEEVFTADHIRKVYGVNAIVQEHPALNCIQVMTIGADQAPQLETAPRGLRNII